MKKQGLITLATTLVTTWMHPDKHHVLYIVMDEPQSLLNTCVMNHNFLCEKNHIFL